MKSKSVFTKHTVSMTEWFALFIDKKHVDKFRKEDNTKDDRLEFLLNTINLKYERPVNFEAIDLKNKSKDFSIFLKKEKNNLCGLRLNPKLATLPKIRSRGLSVEDAFRWFLKQDIQYENYIASWRPHAVKCPLSLIVVVNKDGIFGEVTEGQHSELTQGATEKPTTQFAFDFKKWIWKSKTEKAVKTIKRLIKQIEVKDVVKRNKITKNLKVGFTNNFLNGYYEAVLWDDNVIRFSDYNRILYKQIKKPILSEATTEDINGICVYKGKVRGKTVIVNKKNIATLNFPKGSVLVTDNTDVRFISFMNKSSAIVTDRGGLLSHAAIVARELKKPCIIGTKIATKVLKDGDLVEVDAERGVVRVIK